MKCFIPILVLLLPLTGCYKNNPRPGEPFFCKINGKAFRPEADTGPIGGGGSPPIRVTFDKAIGSLFINVRKSPNSMTLRLRVPPGTLLRKEEHQLFNDITKSRAYYTLNFANSKLEEDLVSKSGKIVIAKADYGIISGTFEFYSESQKTGKVYNITKGCFNDLIVEIH